MTAWDEQHQRAARMNQFISSFRADVTMIARRIDAAATVVVMCGSGCHGGAADGGLLMEVRGERPAVMRAPKAFGVHARNVKRKT